MKPLSTDTFAFWRSIGAPCAVLSLKQFLGKLVQNGEGAHWFKYIYSPFLPGR